MAFPAIAGAFAKGLLGAGARGAAAGGARAVAGNVAKGAAKQGFKKFAQGMTGRTSADYQARVSGVDARTGEYLTPEERKARFKGFATAETKPRSQKLLSGGPTQTVAALPPAGGVGAGADTGQERVVNHLEKIQMYLEKLLIIEQNALSRLQDQILANAREDDRAAAAAEEDKQERGKTKKKTGSNPIVKGMKKKAGGIFSFLMDFAMKFIGLKILDWISKEENREKVQKIVSFFQGVIDFVTTVGGMIGDAFNFTVEAIQTGIEGLITLAGEVQKFFTFEWLDIDALLEPLQPIISFFTERIPEAFNGFLDGMASVVNTLDQLPNQFVGIVQKISDGFLGFLGLGPKETEEFPDKEPGPAPVETGFIPTGTTGAQPEETANDKKPVPDQASNNIDNLPQMKRGGMLHGATHAQGGVPIEAEGGEYILNKRAVAAIGGGILDRLNFGMYPAVGKSTGGGKYGAGGHVVTSSMGNRSFALSPGMHMGVDIATGIGEKLQAINNGVVEAVGYDGGYGNYVSWIDNKTGLGNFYAHMNQPARVKPGQKVNKGTVLGYTGNTGKSSGPHLHWETATNPADTGMSKSAVLSRLNPLSKYSKEDPFGGTESPTSNSSNEGQKQGLQVDTQGSSATPPPSTTQPSTAAPAKMPEVDIGLLLAIMGGGGTETSGAALNNLQSKNNVLTAPGAKTDTPVVMQEEAPAMTTGFDENVMTGFELGDNESPIWQTQFPFNF